MWVFCFWYRPPLRLLSSASLAYFRPRFFSLIVRFRSIQGFCPFCRLRGRALGRRRFTRPPAPPAKLFSRMRKFLYFVLFLICLSVYVLITWPSEDERAVWAAERAAAAEADERAAAAEAAERAAVAAGAAAEADCLRSPTVESRERARLRREQMQIGDIRRANESKLDACEDYAACSLPFVLQLQSQIRDANILSLLLSEQIREEEAEIMHRKRSKCRHLGWAREKQKRRSGRGRGPGHRERR